MFEIVNANVKQGNLLYGHLLNDRFNQTTILIKIETFFLFTEYSSDYQWVTLNEKWIELDFSQKTTPFCIQIPNNCPISYGFYADTKQRILCTCNDVYEELTIEPDLLFHQLIEEPLLYGYTETFHTPCCIMPRSSSSFIQPFWFRRTHFLFYAAFNYQKELSLEDEMLSLCFFVRNENTLEEYAEEETFYKRIPTGTIPYFFEKCEQKVL
jgi:hypothetical protein